MLKEKPKEGESESFIGKGGKAVKLAGTIVSTISSVTNLDQKVPIIGVTVKLWPDKDRKECESQIAAGLEEVAMLLETVEDGKTLIERINKQGVEALKPKDVEALTKVLATYTNRVQGALKAASEFPGAKEALASRARHAHRRRRR